MKPKWLTALYLVSLLYTLFCVYQIWQSHLYGEKYYDPPHTSGGYGNTDMDAQGNIIDMVVEIFIMVLVTRLWSYSRPIHLLRWVLLAAIFFVLIMVHAFLGQEGGGIISIHLEWLYDHFCAAILLGSVHFLCYLVGYQPFRD